MRRENFKFCIVGSGNISRTYVQVIDGIPHADLVAIVSRSGNIPDNAPRSTPVFSSISELNVSCDAVILATPNGTHGQLCEQAADKKLHVLSEKVLEISGERMDRMIRVCENAGVQLAVAFQRRASPHNAFVRKLILDDHFGEIISCDLSVKFYRDDKYYKSGTYRGGFEIDGGGPFIQQASHNLDIYCWFFGMPETVVSMLSTFMHDIEAEDHGVALLHHASGMIATIQASTCIHPGFSPIMEIHGEKGSVILENDRISYFGLDPSLEYEQTNFAVHSGAGSAKVSDISGHMAIVEDFIQSIRKEREPMVPARSGRMATDLAELIYKNNLL